MPTATRRRADRPRRAAPRSASTARRWRSAEEALPAPPARRLCAAVTSALANALSARRSKGGVRSCVGTTHARTRALAFSSGVRKYRLPSSESLLLLATARACLSDRGSVRVQTRLVGRATAAARVRAGVATLPPGLRCVAAGWRARVRLQQRGRCLPRCDAGAVRTRAEPVSARSMRGLHRRSSREGGYCRRRRLRMTLRAGSQPARARARSGRRQRVRRACKPNTNRRRRRCRRRSPRLQAVAGMAVSDCCRR